MITTVICKRCGKTFQSGRTDAKTCSNKCRNAISRTKAQLIASQQEKIVTAICWKCKKAYPKNKLTAVPFLGLEKYYNLICDNCGGKKDLERIEAANKELKEFLSEYGKNR